MGKTSTVLSTPASYNLTTFSTYYRRGMFSSSVRRAALQAPPTPIVSSFSASTPRTVASQARSLRCHQRRFSSSKPSSPADGSNGVAETQAVTTRASKTKGDGEKTRGSKKKAQDVAANSTVKGRDASMLHLPSVPSTNHIDPKRIAASSFFSLHRPMSLTHSYPTVVTDEAFASIFEKRTKNNAKHSEVLATLSTTLKNLDTVTGELEMIKLGPQKAQWDEETDDVRAAITAESYKKMEVQHLDATPEEAGEGYPPGMPLSAPTRYQPFHPPPAPVPMDTADSLAAGAEAAKSPEPSHRTYTAVLTIEESTHANGEVTYLAHSSPLVEEEPPSPPTFRERMRTRQLRYREHRHEEMQLLSEKSDMLAISVKRQRKLKMKKHKYKKLMRRTRNLRRRLDRN